MTLATAAPIVVRRPRPVNTGGVPPAADEMTVGHYLHRPVTADSRHVTDAMIAGRHRHLALAEPMVEVVTAVFVASLTPPGGIVGAASRSRGRHLVSILRHAERAHGTGTVLAITTAEDVIHGTDTEIAGVDEDVFSLRVSM